MNSHAARQVFSLKNYRIAVKSSADKRDQETQDVQTHEYHKESFCLLVAVD